MSAVYLAAKGDAERVYYISNAHLESFRAEVEDGSFGLVRVTRVEPVSSAHLLELTPGVVARG